MHDLAFIRSHPGEFDAGLQRRGAEPAADRILSLDTRRREVTTRLQEAQSRRNEASKAIGQAMGKGDEDTAEKLKTEVAAIKQAMPALEEEGRNLTKDMNLILAALPNLPAEDVPEGADESANVELSRWGTPREFDFTPQEHADLGPPLGLDFETGAALSGARFTFLRGAMARLHRALGQFMLDHQTGNNGYVECNPPVLAWDKALQGTGQLPKFGEDLYPVVTHFFKLRQELKAKQGLMAQLNEYNRFMGAHNTDLGAFLNEQLRLGHNMTGLANIFNDLSKNFDRNASDFSDFKSEFEQLSKEFSELEAAGQDHLHYLIPTAEVSLTNSVREQILEDATLPLRMTALTQCFRSEAGAAGRDTRGFIRQHQFEKVELVSITRSEDSEAEHERMTEAAEGVLQALDLPYRKMLLCTGDMGFTAQRTYDLEVWLPGQGAYREISSCSNCGDFQARRMAARYRPEGSKKTAFVHTLNGSGLAVGRTLVAVLENYQQADGSVAVPEALAPYMAGVTKLEPVR